MSGRIDEIDRRILYHVVADARNTSAPQIAEEMDVSAGTIRNRIKQLESQGVISGYHASVDYERAEGYLVTLFICSASVPDREKLATRAGGVPGVVNVRELMAGRRNVHVVGVGEDANDVTRIAKALSELGLDVEAESILKNDATHPYDPFGPEDDRNWPALADFVSLTGGAEVVEVSVTEDAPVAGKTLSAADADGTVPDDLLVVGIEREENVLTPKGDTRIRAGDLVTLFSRGDATEAAIDAFSTGPRKQS